MALFALSPLLSPWPRRLSTDRTEHFAPTARSWPLIWRATLDSRSHPYFDHPEGMASNQSGAQVQMSSVACRTCECFRNGSPGGDNDNKWQPPSAALGLSEAACRLRCTTRGQCFRLLFTFSPTKPRKALLGQPHDWPP